MRQQYQGKAAITGGVYGQKAVTLQDQDDFLDWLVDKGDGTGPQELYRSVAYTFWCARLRANNIGRIPYYVFPLEVEEEDEEKDKAVEWGIDLRPTLWVVEAWITLIGAAYVLKRIEDLGNGYGIEKLQVLNANTMKVHTWNDDGPVAFIQKVGTQTKIYNADELLYFRTFNPRDDIREGVSSGEVAQRAGELIKNANEWAGAFFANGAIPAVLLTTDGVVPKDERERIGNAWNKMLQGVRRSFRAIVLQMGLKPTVIGQPIKDLAMPELERTKKEQILAAHDLPPGLAEAKTNRAEREQLQFELWDQHLIPYSEIFIEPVLNEQLFNPLGLRVSFQYQLLEAMQRAEAIKSESSAFMANVMSSGYEDNVVSVDEYRAVLDTLLQASGLPPLEETFEPEERTPLQLEPAEDEDEGEASPIEQRIEGRTEKTADEERPKVSAPGWGLHRVSSQN